MMNAVVHFRGSRSNDPQVLRFAVKVNLKSSGNIVSLPPFATLSPSFSLFIALQFWTSCEGASLIDKVVVRAVLDRVVPLLVVAV